MPEVIGLLNCAGLYKRWDNFFSKAAESLAVADELNGHNQTMLPLAHQTQDQGIGLPACCGKPTVKCMPAKTGRKRFWEKCYFITLPMPFLLLIGLYLGREEFSNQQLGFGMGGVIALFVLTMIFNGLCGGWAPVAKSVPLDVEKWAKDMAREEMKREMQETRERHKKAAIAHAVRAKLDLHTDELDAWFPPSRPKSDQHCRDTGTQ
jgi:hypothetical protein